MQLAFTFLHTLRNRRPYQRIQQLNIANRIKTRNSPTLQMHDLRSSASKICISRWSLPELIGRRPGQAARHLRRGGQAPTAVTTCGGGWPPGTMETCCSRSASYGGGGEFQHVSGRTAPRLSAAAARKRTPTPRRRCRLRTGRASASSRRPGSQGHAASQRVLTSVALPNTTDIYNCL